MIMFNKIVEFLFCADIIKTPKVFCLTFGVLWNKGIAITCFSSPFCESCRALENNIIQKCWAGKPVQHR